MSITIIGGGMVGATLALALSHFTKQKLHIDLVEGQTPNDSTVHMAFDSRAIALAQGTCQSLEEIGVWSELVDKTTPISHVQVSDRGHFGSVSIDAKEFGLPALGRTIELRDAGEKLFSLLHSMPNIKIHCPAKLIEINRSKERVTIRLDNGDVISTQLLVAADGSFSTVGDMINARWKTDDYHQVAFIAQLEMEQAHQGWAYERFTPSGSLALLPMAQDRSSLIWCHPANERQRIENWDNAEFIEQLQQDFGWKLGVVKYISPRKSYPLMLRRVERRISHRVVLIGNTAQTLHPIAGQGFNLATRDLMSLAKLLNEAFKHDQDLGSHSLLYRYNQQRDDDQRQTILLTDSLVCLFASSSWPLTLGRNAAMLLMDRFTPIRHTLAKRFMGLIR